MANLQEFHYHTPPDGDGVDSQHEHEQVTRGGRFKLSKSSLTFLGLSCLALLSIITVTPFADSNSRPTSLFGVVNSKINSKSGFAAPPFSVNKQLRPFPLNTQPRWSRIPANANFELGQKAEYYSPSNGRWVPCKIEKEDKQGRVQIDIKMGTWIQPEPKTLRKPGGVFAGFLANFGGDGYDASKALSSDEYIDGSMAQGYARAREARKAFIERERSGGKTAPVAAPRAKSVFTQVTGALDFQEDIKADRATLAAASRLKKGQQMSKEQSGALARKVVGTKGGFFGETVEVEGAYTDKGYVADPSEEGPWWKRLKLR